MLQNLKWNLFMLSFKYISLKNYLLGITLFYLVFFFPKPISAFVFVFYCYVIYYVFNYLLNLKTKLVGCALLVLPMVLIKATHHGRFDIIAFAGLSYVTFRAIQIYFENDRNYSPKPVAPHDYLLFMLFPPTILIGPIDRFNRFKGDLDANTGIDAEKINEGLHDFILGVLQKYILAEIVNRFWLSKVHADSRQITDMLNMMYAY